MASQKFKVTGKLFGKGPQGDVPSGEMSLKFEAPCALSAAAMFGAAVADTVQELLAPDQELDWRIQILDAEDITPTEFRVWDQVELRGSDGTFGEVQLNHEFEWGTVRQVSDDGDFDVEVVFADGQSCWCSNNKVKLHRRAQPAIPHREVVEVRALPAPTDTFKVGDIVQVNGANDEDPSETYSYMGQIFMIVSDEDDCNYCVASVDGSCQEWQCRASELSYP